MIVGSILKKCDKKKFLPDIVDREILSLR